MKAIGQRWPSISWQGIEIEEWLRCRRMRLLVKVRMGNWDRMRPEGRLFELIESGSIVRLRT